MSVIGRRLVFTQTAHIETDADILRLRNLLRLMQSTYNKVAKNKYAGEYLALCNKHSLWIGYRNKKWLNFRKNFLA